MMKGYDPNDEEIERRRTWEFLRPPTPSTSYIHVKAMGRDSPEIIKGDYSISLDTLSGVGREDGNVRSGYGLNSGEVSYRGTYFNSETSSGGDVEAASYDTGASNSSASYSGKRSSCGYSCGGGGD